MFQSSQQQNKGGKKNTDTQSKQNGPHVNRAEFFKASLNVFDNQAQPAQMKSEEEDVQAKKASDQPAQMQEEEELQAKMSNSSPIQAMVEEEEGMPTQKKAVQMQEEEELQAKEGNNIAGNQQNIANTSSGTSTKMPEQVQAKMENSFGSDFSGVNIQQNSDQATNMGALAFTQGSNIHFAPGQYKPNSMSGQELLGHELTHVVQQKAGKVKGSQNKNGFNVNSSPSLENEADINGKKAAQGQQVDVAGVGSGVQRKEDNKNVKSASGSAPIKSNEVNWKYKPELVKHFYPDYEGNDIHMFTYTYIVDGKTYIIMRQDWSKGDNIGDFRYWATTDGNNWTKFKPTSRIDGLSEDLTNAAAFMLGTAGATVGFAALVEAGALSGIINTSWKSILAGMGKDFTNQMIVKGGNIKEVDFINVAAAGLIKNSHIKNAIASALDYSIKLGYDQKGQEDFIVEFLLREGTDYLVKGTETFLKQKGAEIPKDFGYEYSKDLTKKVFREVAKRLYMENKKDIHEQPEQ